MYFFHLCFLIELSRSNFIFCVQNLLFDPKKRTGVIYEKFIYDKRQKRKQDEVILQTIERTETHSDAEKLELFSELENYLLPRDH